MPDPAYRIHAKPRGAPESEWAEVKRLRPRGPDLRQRKKAFAQADAMRAAKGRGLVFRTTHESAARQVLDRLMEDEDYDAAENFYERVDSQRADIVGEFQAKKGKGLISWRPVKAAELAALWLEFGKRGSVRDEEAVGRIAEQVMDLIARLYVTTELSGHTSHDGRPETEDLLGRQFTDEEWDALLGMLETKSGGYLVSDYGLEPLMRLYRTLHAAGTAEDKILAIDRILNVVHQRSDLASLFVQGGQQTLTKIANQGGYSTFAGEEDPWKARVAAQHGALTGKGELALKGSVGPGKPA